MNEYSKKQHGFKAYNQAQNDYAGYLQRQQIGRIVWSEKSGCFVRVGVDYGVGDTGKGEQLLHRDKEHEIMMRRIHREKK